jgi:hypothetical protein
MNKLTSEMYKSIIDIVIAYSMIKAGTKRRLLPAPAAAGQLPLCKKAQMGMPRQLSGFGC